MQIESGNFQSDEEALGGSKGAGWIAQDIEQHRNPKHGSTLGREGDQGPQGVA